MSITIGIIAIILAFVLLIVLCYKGFSVTYVAPLCAILIAVICGLPLLDTMTGYVAGDVIVGAFSQGLASFIVPLFPVFMLSILIGRVYIASGAATNIARTLMNAFAKGGSTAVALRIVLPVLMAASLSISPEALHRIATVTSTTFDTLPFQSPIIIMLAMADLKHKEGYPPVMMCTVVMTGIATIAVALLFVLFPGLK